MPTDKQNVDFLYSIIRQLEVKHIQWPVVAEQNDIPNGHAARMRFHRLKQAQEAKLATPRVVTEKGGPKGAKTKSQPLKRKAKDEGEKLRKKIAILNDEEDEEEDAPLLAKSEARKRMKIKEDEDFAEGAAAGHEVGVLEGEDEGAAEQHDSLVDTDIKIEDSVVEAAQTLAKMPFLKVEPEV